MTNKINQPKKLIYETCTIIIPALNEARTVNHVLTEALKFPSASQVILVDDGSTDKTEQVINKFRSDQRFLYLKHKVNRGKGRALKTGLSRAVNEIILFLDADLINISVEKIKKIVWPVLTDEVDVSRGSFKLARGRVTEIAVKPMMKILFPDYYFEQPISGQVCAKKDFLTNLDLESKWGVDIGILMDAINAGQRIIEVDIGKLEHKARTVEEKAEMAEQVLETMIKKAGLIQHKYKLIVFTLDYTLIKKESLPYIFQQLQLDQKLDPLNLVAEKPSDFQKIVRKSAKLLKGYSGDQIRQIVLKTPLERYAKEVILALKRRKYQVAILSSNFCPIVETIAEKLEIDLVDCINLEKKKGLLTGKVTDASSKRWLTVDRQEAFKHSFQRIVRKAKAKPSETIMVASSRRAIPLLNLAGLSIVYRSTDKEIKEAADKTINILAELLAIIE